jgi:hypothetical protein
MKIQVTYTIDSAECEAVIKEDGRPEAHVLDITVRGLLARVKEYILRRQAEEQIPN